ncbi:glycine zipper 2TM domain-containing protein [Rhizorhapis sp.]|uniref:glycine zipper 2TM domain-containing protein n=1 Tax=Rhizorhapis sp. TaxID=1968842 RepID=UPI002B491D57|nr:glycine zipper 2TM domain-containing protein [Rhizorhapis sp.]HKR18282.1 glycine zipper 2TM domain-containing protein [Rhizorhapis sp.]
MMKKFLLSLSAAAAVMSAAAVVPTAPAMASHGYDRGDYYRDYDRGYYRDYDRRYSRGDYYRGDRYYRGRDYDRRYYSRKNRGRCDSGTGGTIIGAIAGGLLGNEIVGRRGDRTAGTIIGAGVGALAGRAIDRNC